MDLFLWISPDVIGIVAVAMLLIVGEIVVHLFDESSFLRQWVFKVGDSLFASFSRYSPRPRWRTTKSDVLPCFRSGRTLELAASTTIQLYCGYQVIYSTWDVKLNNVAQCKNVGFSGLLTLSNFVLSINATSD